MFSRRFIYGTSERARRCPSAAARERCRNEKLEKLQFTERGSRTYAIGPLMIRERIAKLPQHSSSLAPTPKVHSPRNRTSRSVRDLEERKAALSGEMVFRERRLRAHGTPLHASQPQYVRSFSAKVLTNFEPFDIGLCT